MTTCFGGNKGPSRNVPIQDLGDIIPRILEIKNKARVPLVIRVQIEIGDKDTQPDDETVRALNQLLENIDKKFRFENQR